MGEGRPEYENVSYYGNVIFWTASLEKYSRTRWSRIVGTAAYDKVTTRNYNTFMKLRSWQRIINKIRKTVTSLKNKTADIELTVKSRRVCLTFTV